MISSRELSRRSFCNAIAFVGINAFYQPDSIPFKKRLFKLGNRVKVIEPIFDPSDPKFSNFDGLEGQIVGYCWSYPEWSDPKMKSEWTYFIQFDPPKKTDENLYPVFDFEAESNLAIA